MSTLEQRKRFREELNFPSQWPAIQMKQFSLGLLDDLERAEAKVGRLKKTIARLQNQVPHHNHITRDIKPPGKCPECDQYYVSERARLADRLATDLRHEHYPLHKRLTPGCSICDSIDLHDKLRKSPSAPL